MSAKILRTTTIIPDALYVEREADRQLRRVLEDMGRPGYVLVARQMGKTNLLLHAKRALEDRHNVYVYLDLSGAYRTDRECFRAIIDTAVETHPGAFPGLADRFASERARRDLPAHKEHEAELRALLAAISGKLVIILDEIDALTRSEYSDRIFSQIRSTYFSRVNFPEYARLTYVLSGVAEPADIIRNPNLSPFNIGEKIYLDDFTPDESRAFLQKAGLVLADAAWARVEWWAGGNPRITWDICSELEDRVLAGEDITSDVVDRTVTKLYLTSFDRAPVDHIRRLVENDKLVRSAVTEIRYGHGDKLSDAVRSRLYLAGIIKADVRKVAIKNPVVDKALSDQWLKDVDLRRSGTLSVAREAINNARYGDAIAMLREFLERGGADAQDVGTAHYYLALAYYHSGQYREAIPEFQAGLCDRAAYAALYVEQIHRMGMCHVYAGDLDSARVRFEEVLSLEPRERVLELRAMMSLASIYLSMDFTRYRDLIFGYATRVIEGARQLENEEGREVAQQILAATRVNLSRAYLKAGDSARALSVLDEAAGGAPVDLKPRILLERLHVESESERRPEYIRAIADAIVGAGLEVKAPRVEAPLAFDNDALDEVLAAAYKDLQPEVFERVVQHVASRSSEPVRKRAELLYSVASHVFFTTVDLEAAKQLLSRAWADAVAGGLSGKPFDKIAKLYAWFVAGEPGDVLDKYLARFDSPEPPSALDWLDFGIVARAAQALQKRGEHGRALEALRPALARLESGAPVYGVGLEYLALESHAALGHADEERAAAAAIVRLAPNVKFDTATRGFLDSKTLKRILARAEGVLGRSIRPLPRTGRRIGRNEWVVVRYGNAPPVREKFKKVEADLDSGKCELVN